MILESKINDKKYIWVKVPRTGSVFYTLNFFPGIYDERVVHFHAKYIDMINAFGNYPGLAVVREPLSRFISMLRYSKSINLSPNLPDYYKINIPVDTIDILCDFIEENFDKNCKTDKSYDSIFEKEDSGFGRALFKTQSYYVYHPRVKIFRYENLKEFDKWLETELGVIVNQEVFKNQSPNNLLSHLDFENERFVRIVENIFYMDYKVFDYPFRYLT